MAPQSTFGDQALEVVLERVQRLRKLTFAGALALPKARGEDIVIGGTKVQLTVYRQIDVPLLEGQILVIVQVARSRWLGMVSTHIERGLVFSLATEVRDATNLELQNSGG